MLLLEPTPWDPSFRTRWTLRTVCCSRKEGCRFSYIAEMQHFLDTSSRWDIARFLHMPRRSFTVLHAQWEAGHWWTHRDGRSLCWCLTVMVEPFSEIGMIAQVSAIQPTMDRLPHPSCDPVTLPEHLHGLLERASSDLDNLQKSQLGSTLLEFVDLFPVPGSALTGYTDAVEHTIDTGDRPPVRCAPRHMSPQKIKQEEVCVDDMLSGGQIELSDSPWSAPVVLVTKKDGGTRFCVDYRWLNLATVKDTYPLPRIDDTLDMLAGKRWFSTLDLASGYWQVSLSPEARCKTAFATHSGLFQFRVMPFGLCNAPATFERLMDRVLQGLRWSRCLVYLDDIISFGTTFDDSLDNLTLIFE